jgi:hypothetical protein
MANATSNLVRVTIGKEGYIFDLPVDGGTHIYEGTLVTQLTATGMVVPHSTGSSGWCVGVAQHEQDNTAGADGAKRVRIESCRAFAFPNGAGGDAFADTDLIGVAVYASDDHTVAKGATGEPIGWFLGFETDGKVRVFIDPAMARFLGV